MVSSSRVFGTAVLALRVLLGAVFVYAAWAKLRQPWELFAMSIDAYKVLPYWAVVAVARTLPWAEMLLGLALMAGLWLRITAGAASLLLAGYLFLTWAGFRGRRKAA